MGGRQPDAAVAVGRGQLEDLPSPRGSRLHRCGADVTIEQPFGRFENPLLFPDAFEENYARHNPREYARLQVLRAGRPHDPPYTTVRFISPGERPAHRVPANIAGMRSESTSEKVRGLMEALGRETSGPGRIYLTGGTSAVLVGWRDATVDVDLKADPEPRNFFEALSTLKNALDINIELAAPADFMPELPGWRERSVFIDRFGTLEFFHYDFYSQALAKIQRGHARDLTDVCQMLERGLVKPSELRRLFKAVVPQMVRYPAIEPEAFHQRLEEFLAEVTGDVSDGR